MRIATYNINSVRLRLPLLAELVPMLKADVLCLQETKTPDEHYPFDALKDFGFTHQAFVGNKGYNGVAILSKTPLTDIQIHQRCNKADARHISARTALKGSDAPVEIHNIYIPAGGYEADPIINPKFQHKLDFVDELTQWFPKNAKKTMPLVVVGDLNIAPMEHDVWDHKKMLKVVSHTPEETTRFEKFFKSMNFTDAVRHFVPENEKVYTWWSYRAADWEAADKGRRLDHVWVTAPLAPRLKSHTILKAARGMERPSDHVPIVVEVG